jgi:hypothetical protein
MADQMTVEREERLPPVHPGEVLLEDFMKPLNQYTGSDFDDFLREEGILEEVTARASRASAATSTPTA